MGHGYEVALASWLQILKASASADGETNKIVAGEHLGFGFSFVL